MTAAGRMPLVAGNWKMHTSLAEGLSLVDKLIPLLVQHTTVERVLCPPYLHLARASERLVGTGILLAAQNLYWEDSGAFTGEISGAMLNGLCAYVIVGHSERRAHFGDTDETVRRRLMAALRHRLCPILCVGETLDEREAGVAAEVVSRQLGRALEGLGGEAAGRVVIAYEPVWAIGTGRAATPEAADEIVSKVIRPQLARQYSADLGAKVRILYGGSVTAGNARSFFSLPDVDGGLVGGASLKAEEFASIVAAAA